MVVGVCRLVVAMPGTRSLKEKRSRLRPLLAALRHEYKVSVAEVEQQDVPDKGVIAFAVVSTDRRLVNSLIDRIVNRVETLAQVRLQESSFEITNY